ncbi:beta-lactamase hydrolase domain-containing protein [Limimaricola litoreus]|uniref:Protein tyrosine phosphatase family protein n=1 Tax=Limimaricola litoreus TaxID=2955316 RepID=A0A9X2FV09_9RHOB|nr:protein tyrosine phosphatase family protein [Limimaricola litoreus]MCP1167658.1 protein tyrosine phosphatase family protein [Limimaricola litoreus]
MQDTVQINDRFTVAKFAPEAEQIRQAGQEGFRSIINMQTDDEDKKLKMKPDEEGRLAEEAGLTYLHHPVDGQSLSNEVVDAFRRKATELPAPVLVHCASGKRSGALVMMHIASENGMSGEEVIEKAEEMGFECDTPELESFVKDYVNNHNGG